MGYLRYLFYTYETAESFVYFSHHATRVLFSERKWLVTRVQPCSKGMRLAEFHQYLTSNGFREGRLTMLDSLQLVKLVLPTALHGVDEVHYGDLYPCVFVHIKHISCL